MLKTGTSVVAKWSEGLWYEASVTRVAGDQIGVVFDADGSTATVSRSDVSTADDAADAKYAQIQVGAKVRAPWSDGASYPGVVSDRRGKVFAIAYDDGSEAWVDHVELVDAQENSAKVRAVCAQLDGISMLEPSLDQIGSLLVELDGIEDRAALTSILALLERFSGEESHGVFETARHRIEAVLVRDPTALEDIRASFVRRPCVTTLTILYKIAKFDDPAEKRTLEVAMNRTDLPVRFKKDIAGYLELLA